MSTSMSPTVESLLEVIQQVVGSSSKGHAIALHEPAFSCTKYWVYVKDFLNSGWVSTFGSWVSCFEQHLCDNITGAGNSVAAAWGRAHALGLLLRPIWTSLYQLPIYQVSLALLLLW